MTPKVKESIIKIIKSCESAQFCTHGSNEYPETRFIANYINQDRDDFPLYFITHHSSHKIEQITKNQNICLYYFNPNTRMAITLFGIAKEKTDKDSKDKFWRDDWKNYGFKEKTEKEYVIIEFVPKVYKFYINGNEEQTGTI